MRRAGFTLVEVVVALLILDVGLLGAMGLIVLAQRTLAEADLVERGVADLEGVLDSLGWAAQPGGGARDVQAGRIEWSVGADGTLGLRFEPRAGGRVLEVSGRVRVPVGGGG